MVEQNARMALEISHHGYVMEIGSIVFADTAANLLERSEMLALVAEVDSTRPFTGPFRRGKATHVGHQLINLGARKVENGKDQ